MINAICLAVFEEQRHQAVVTIALQIMAAVRKVGGQAEPVSRINAFVTFIY